MFLIVSILSTSLQGPFMPGTQVTAISMWSDLALYAVTEIC